MDEPIPTKRAPALLSIVVALSLGWSGWLGWSSWKDDLGRAPLALALTNEPELPSVWRQGFLVIPDRPPPPTPAERLEARLAQFASHIDRLRTSMAPPLVAFGAEALRADIEQAIARVDDRAQVSVHVRDLESGRVLFDYYGDTLLNPASNTKLLTTSAALDLLGPDYVFETRALLVDETLYLIGEGDPTIDAAALGLLAQEVAERLPAGAITQILVDDTAFSPQVFGPGYVEEGWGVSYMAPSGALSVNFNTVEVTVHPVKGSVKPAVVVQPPSTHVVVDNRARTGTRTALAIRSIADPPAADEPERTEVETHVVVEGQISKRRRGYEVRRRVVDPGLFAGGAFAQMLADASQTEVLPVGLGVAPRVELATSTSDEASEEAGAEHLELPAIIGQDRDGDDILLVARRRSPPLIEIVGGLLAYSNNFVAEQILRTLGWRMTGDPGDWDNGSAVIRGYWAALGIDPASLVFENGSGLSAVGRMTTAGLVDLMAVAARTQVAGASLFDALPVAGSSAGTVGARLRRSKRRVRAKTGTLDGVSGLTGVITSEDGTPQVAFSILTNVRETGSMAAKTRRKTEDAIVMAVLDRIDGWEAIRAVQLLELDELHVTP